MNWTNFSRIITATCLPLVVSGAIAGTNPGTGIYGTVHDFSGTGFINPAVAEVGLCTICHTPHKAQTTSLLWNQKLTTAVFNWGDTQTYGGTPLPSSAHLGPSTKCLSCHDGTVAVGDVSLFNKQTSGTAAGTIMIKIGQGSMYSIGYKGNMTGNHPIAIPYPLNSTPSTYNGITTGSAVILNEFVANPHSPATSVKLYNDDGHGVITTGPAAGASGIECTTCHDPHNKQAQDKYFVRGRIQGSSVADGYICLKCHIK